MNAERMMNAVLAHGREHTDLANEKVPVPVPGSGEVLVAVYATAATAGELSWPDDVPFIPGHDVSGRIVELGGGVTTLAVNDEVIGLIDFDRPGAAADYTVVPAHHLAPKPTSIDHVSAAALPLASLTAWQALYQHYQLKQNDHVLVHGGAGGVGSYVVQLAARHGARVTATAGPSSVEYVGSLGATKVIDYTTRFEDQVSEVDVVVDTVGGDTVSRSRTVLRSGGTMLCIAEEPPVDYEDAHDINAVYFIVEPNRNQLIELSRLVDRDLLRITVKEVLPLDKASDAFAPQTTPHSPGKMVLRLR